MHTLIPSPQAEAQVASTDLHDGLNVLELEERLELASLVAAAAASQRCDISTSSEAV